MHRSTELQFHRLPPEARRAALWRMAWSGRSPEQIAQRIGWSAEQVRRAMHEEQVPASSPWNVGYGVSPDTASTSFG